MKKSIVQIDLGECCWRVKEIQGMSFGSKKAAEQYAKNHDVESPSTYHIDTRPTISQVGSALNQVESRIWDEGISIFPTIDRERKWPSHWEINRIVVIVTEGSNEGFYLHVESIDSEGKTEILISGKTLDCSEYQWTECWKSASRIYRLLNDW